MVYQEDIFIIVLMTILVVSIMKPPNNKLSYIMNIGGVHPKLIK